MPPVPELTVYERAGCHLCEDMLATLSEWQEELEFEVRRIDVDGAPELAARFGPRVPVLVHGSTEICHFFLDLDALRRTLGDGSNGLPLPPGHSACPESESDGRDLLRDAGRYARIHAIVRMIPRGRVATYGQVAAIEGNSTARMVGYALAALSGSDRDVPWQRVLNRAGTVSERSGGGGIVRQRRALEAEGVLFDAKGRIDFDTVGWNGPDIDWIDEHGFHPAPRPGSAGRHRR